MIDEWMNYEMYEKWKPSTRSCAYMELKVGLNDKWKIWDINNRNLWENGKPKNGPSSLGKGGQLVIPKTIAEEPFEGVGVPLTLNRNIQHKLYLYIYAASYLNT